MKNKFPFKNFKNNARDEIDISYEALFGRLEEKVKTQIRKIWPKKEGEILNTLPKIIELDTVEKLGASIREIRQKLEHENQEPRWINDFYNYAQLIKNLKETGDLKYLLKLSNTFQIIVTHPDTPNNLRQKYVDLQSNRINEICTKNKIIMTPDPGRTQWRSKVQTGIKRSRFSEKFMPDFHLAVGEIDFAEGIPKNHIAAVNRYGFAGSGKTENYIFQRAHVVVVGDDPLLK